MFRKKAMIAMCVSLMAAFSMAPAIAGEQQSTSEASADGASVSASSLAEMDADFEEAFLTLNTADEECSCQATEEDFWSPDDTCSCSADCGDGQDAYCECKTVDEGVECTCGCEDDTTEGEGQDPVP
jgi:hypothetical protein